MVHYVYYCTMRIIHAIILLLLFVAGFMSCKENYDAPCRAIAYESVLLSSAEKSWLAFTTADTLSYLTLPSDSLINGYVLPEAATWGRITRPGSNPECPPDSLQFEQLNYTIKFNPTINTIRVMFDKRSRELVFSADSDVFRLSFLALSSPDSVTISSASWSGRVFSDIYARTSRNDSLYYTKTDGIVRYKHSASGYQLQ